MFQLAVVKDCQIPLKSGLPSVVRGISVVGRSGRAWATAGELGARPTATTAAAATVITPLARSLAKLVTPQRRHKPALRASTLSRALEKRRRLCVRPLWHIESASVNARLACDLLLERPHRDDRHIGT